MGNPFNPCGYGCGYGSIATNEYSPYNTHSSSTTGYNVPTTKCDTTK